jgi:hypothetical protein
MIPVAFAIREKMRRKLGDTLLQPCFDSSRHSFSSVPFHFQLALRFHSRALAQSPSMGADWPLNAAQKLV